MDQRSEDLRNIAIAGHNGTGKTAFLEQMLACAGVITKAEMIQSGKTVSDYTEEEIQKQISIHSSLATMIWMEKRINAMDTPGTADFIGETICAFRSCEGAVMMIDARDGAQIETIKLWRRLDKRSKPRIIFLNKMDRSRVDFEKAFPRLKNEFNTTFVPITIPMGSGEDFKGVINLIENKAYFSEDGKERVAEIPDDYKEIVATYRETLVESAAEGADDLMEKFFAEGDLSADEIRRGVTEGLDKNVLVPAFCGCTKTGAGITSVMNFIAHNFPSPIGQKETIIKDNGEQEEFEFNPEGKPSAFVFKTTIDQFSGKLSYIKMVTGTLTGDTELTNPAMGRKERPGKLYRAVGKKLIETDMLCAGDIGIIAKSNSAATNCSLLGSSEMKYTFLPVQFPTPVYALAISAGDKKSEDKMNDSLHKITEEDLTFQLSFNEETKQSVVSGMGELHINMVLDKIKDKQKININTELPKVAFRETITKKSGIAEYAHKKQSGGHGQYGKVLIEIEPLERGEMYAFRNAVKGGNVSKGYIPGIEKGFHEAMVEGVLAGYPMVDISITLIDGKEHPVDSSEMAFKLAAKGALKIAIEKAGPVLLEPYMTLSVYIENEYLGDILSDLSSKRGRVQGQEDIGGDLLEVKAEVPQSEMLNYAIDLKSMTSGTGSFELDFDHYETLSGKMADDIIKAAKAEKESE